MVTNNDEYRQLAECYPNMSSALQKCLDGHELSLVDLGLERGLHVFGGRFTGDGKVYDQRDFRITIDRTPVGRIREISHFGRLVFAQVQIEPGNHLLAVKGSGFYVQYDFERQKRIDDNPFFAFP